MSRTDKDRPYRVRAHDPHEPGRYFRHYHNMRWLPRASCDVCDAHLDSPEHRSSGYNSYCGWTLGYTFNPYGDAPPRWYRRHIWHAPERVRERDELRAARDLYNSGDDLEDFDFANFQAHNCAKYYWW